MKIFILYRYIFSKYKKKNYTIQNSNDAEDSEDSIDSDEDVDGEDDDEDDVDDSKDAEESDVENLVKDDSVIKSKLGKLGSGA